MLLCPKCKKQVEVELSESGPHIKASCIECGSYIKFISERELKGEPKMSEFELFFRLEGSKYGDGVMLNKYGDVFSLVAANESQNGGTVYKRWAFPQDKDKQPRSKAIPMGVTLGNRTQAIGILKGMIVALEGEEKDQGRPRGMEKLKDFDDITF